MSIHDYLKMQQDLLDAVDPPAIRMMRQLHDMVDPPGQRRVRELLDGLTPPAGVLLHDPFLSDESAFRNIEAAIGYRREADIAQQALVNQVAAGRILDTVSKMHDAIRLSDDSLAAKLWPFAELERKLASIIDVSTSDMMSRHLADVALPSLSFLSVPWQQRFGLLTTICEERRGASLTWLADAGADTNADADEVNVALAAFIMSPSITRKRDLVIQTRVLCVLCREPLISKSETFEWVGETMGVIDIEAVPICASCLKKDPVSYLERMLEAIQQKSAPRYRFELIDGQGLGTGQPHGRDHLRLVRSNITDDESNPED